MYTQKCKFITFLLIVQLILEGYVYYIWHTIYFVEVLLIYCLISNNIFRLKNVIFLYLQFEKVVFSRRLYLKYFILYTRIQKTYVEQNLSK